MKRFCLTLAFLLVMLSLIEGWKGVCSYLSALKCVDDVYAVRTNQTVICLGASCTGCSIVTERTRFKAIWLASSCSELSVVAPVARLLELLRRREMGQVTHCIMETCLFSYAEDIAGVGSENMTASLWLQELPVNWRFKGLIPVSKSVYWRSLGRMIKTAALRQWDFRFKICDLVDYARRRMLTRDPDWRQERIDYYGKRDFLNYDGKVNAVDKRIKEFLVARDICRQNNIELVVIVPPMSSFYLLGAPVGALERCEKLKEALRGRGIVVLDFLRNYPDELFFDPTHLTHEGALKFTQELEGFLDEQSSCGSNNTSN